jgi:hypothetical protein
MVTFEKIRLLLPLVRVKCLHLCGGMQPSTTLDVPAPLRITELTVPCALQVQVTSSYAHEKQG